MICESCGSTENIAGVACVPGVPYSACYCVPCLRANSHPLPILVANTAVCGGLDQMCAEWRQMVTDSLAHQNVTLEEFNRLVDVAITDLNAEVSDGADGNRES